MRGFLIKCLLIILIIMTSILITSGLSDGSLGIESFVNLQQKTRQLNIAVQELEQQNTSNYEAKRQALLEAVDNYKKEKEEYEKLITQINQVGNGINNAFDLYDIDFLWTIIGNYATEEGVVLQFDVSKSSNNVEFLNADYILCDLNFTVIGEYLSILNFIYDLEQDDRLNFEINNFKLEKVGESLESTFIVNSIPINKINLSTVKEKDIIDGEEKIQ